MGSRKELVTVVKEWAGLTIGVMVLLASFAGFVLQQAHAQTVDAVATARADAGVVARRVEEVEKMLDRHVHEESESRIEVRREVREVREAQVEVQRDIRDLYRALRDGKRSERLERDAGAEGGGAKR